MIVRAETPRDLVAIREVNIVAFEHHPFSHQTLTSTSLTPNFIAFSAACIGDTSEGWFLLGPVAVRPERQGEGIGRALVESGLAALRSRGACGCVLVGDPAFYRRFGFQQHSGTVWDGVPDENVVCLSLSEDVPTGEVLHHPAFLVGT